MKNFIKKVYVYFFLILFLGYYGSITLFYHTHVVMGETIVHSHPFKADKNGKPIHSHTTNGYITIHFLSCLTISVLILFFTFKTVRPLVHEIVFKTKEGLVNQIKFVSCSLRAPPSEMLK